MDKAITIKKKICLLGSFAVGKTSLIDRFVNNQFEEKYLTTIGVKISQKILPPVQDEQRQRNIQHTFLIWDIAGLEKFDHVTDNYLRGADVPEYPVLFMKNPSAALGHGQPIRIPAVCDDEVDYEAELAIIIGKPCLKPQETLPLHHPPILRRHPSRLPILRRLPSLRLIPQRSPRVLRVRRPETEWIWCSDPMPRT